MMMSGPQEKQVISGAVALLVRLLMNRRRYLKLRRNPPDPDIVSLTSCLTGDTKAI
jgi:hypothetical protein